MAKIKDSNLMDSVEGEAKVDTGPIKTDQQKTRQPDTIVKILGGLSQAPKSKVVQSYPVIVGKCLMRKIKKI